MRRLILFAIAVLVARALQAQGTVSERAAKEAVHRIVQHSGLLADFVVREDASIPTAVAYIKGHDRIIAYNPVFIATIADSSRTDWSAVSILAHEVAHHLLGHTLDPDALHPGDELACDRYSGFVLYGMGATLDEALAAIAVAGDPHGTQRHPPRSARAAAIRQGWTDAQCLHDRVDSAPFVLQDDLRYVVHFAGDRNTYYVDQAGRLLWFDQHAEPIEFGRCSTEPDAKGLRTLTWEQEVFTVDRHDAIWSGTVNGMQRHVGQLRAYARP